MVVLQVFEDVITDDEDSMSEEDRADAQSKKPDKTRQNTIKYDSDDEGQVEDLGARVEEVNSGTKENEASERDDVENNVQSNDTEALSRSRITSVDKEEASSNNCDKNTGKNFSIFSNIIYIL